MIIVSVHYPYNAEARFDSDYYLKKHVPLALDRMGDAVKAVFVEIGVSAVDTDKPPQFAASFYAYFESTEAFFQAFTPHVGELQADIPNYTDITPLFQIGNVGFARINADMATEVSR